MCVEIRPTVSCHAEQLKGVCYLAYLVPMIGEVEPEDMATLQIPFHRQTREISKSQAIVSIFIPFYVTVSEVLENNLSASSEAMFSGIKSCRRLRQWCSKTG